MLSFILHTLSLCIFVAFVTGQQERCEEITIPMCKGIGYNYTSMPNKFHHDTQEEAGLEVHQFWPLVEIHCSDDLLFFLCSLYAPICIEDYHGQLPACYSVCERAKAGCAPIMHKYGFVWPERMNCDDFPRYGDQEHLCMDAKEGAGPENGEINTKQETKPVRKPPSYRGRNSKARDRHDSIVPGGSTGRQPGLVTPGPDTECTCECRFPMVPLVDPAERRVYNDVSTGGVPYCARPCRGTFFSKDEQTFASFWIGLMAIICCVSASLTVLTFIIDPSRFRYPERPIIFLSGCYLMVSVGYLVRLGLGHEAVACDGQIIRYHTTGRPPACTIVFFLVYFFGMASSLWWVILTLTWLLAAGLKWGNEAIAGYSQYFHLAAWLVPTGKSIAVLAMGAVDGDPVAGVCSVGNQNVDHLRWFVIFPLCAYLVLGTSFLLAGFVSLFRIRKVIRQQARAKADKLEKLMIRIGVFSVLYTVPATIVIGCHIYEQYYRERWDRRHNCPCETDTTRPDYSVFMLKYFMCLVVGITSGCWITSTKTIESWRNRLCSRRGHRSGPGSVSQRTGTPGGTDALYGPRTFKPLSPASHVGHVPSSCKQVPLSHV
ncbi:frizzled-5 [Parasteatoda tepidariorum]|uniref:Frizzled-5 n=1 Tax=Parasteatoda tepidariorum TaxID=114398 RepID=A0A2Z6DTI9_PARTP|nr:frizzled-5 [Parasteatoda tepidariorum]XP_015922949.1 frizzled-5 [Parasteatoda tepidariorum]XP_015922952.1 frizzled-5 [Parasteatoda tepidariorum]XP_042904005.1 frizzled-5 [Parasteatoda tepidariorum]XP_042904006.1 frizzled-5 [Parasteatoda tepidariorum]BBD75254.1 frizzled-5 [Parasteatoda tepidariorum]